MSLVTTPNSDVYHLLHMCRVYMGVRMMFWALENLTPDPPPLRSAIIYIYFFSDNHRNHFSKDILSTDSRFTHISAIKADTNTLSQSPCKAGPHSTTMTMSQNITSPVFTKRPANYITQKAKINDSGNNL